GIVFETDLSVATTPYLDDHRIEGLVVVPAVVFLQAALAAAAALGEGPWQLEDVLLREALVLGEEERRVQTILTPREGGASFTIHSRGPDGWRLHASGEIAAAAGAGELWPEPEAAEVSRDAFYAATHDLGFAFGPQFQGV